MLMIPRNLEALPQANALIRRPHHIGIALLHRIHQSELDGVDTQFGGKLGDGQLKTEGNLGNTWRAIRMNFGFVGVNRTARGARIGKLVARRSHICGEGCRGAVISP